MPSLGGFAPQNGDTNSGSLLYHKYFKFKVTESGGHEEILLFSKKIKGVFPPPGAPAWEGFSHFSLPLCLYHITLWSLITCADAWDADGPANGA